MTMPWIAFVPDIRGVCSNVGTFEFTSKPRKIASARIVTSKTSKVLWLTPRSCVPARAPARASPHTPHPGWGVLSRRPRGRRYQADAHASVKHPCRLRDSSSTARRAGRGPLSRGYLLLARDAGSGRDLVLEVECQLPLRREVVEQRAHVSR